MTTPTGTISMTDIQTEFGGSNPISLNEYYAGGSYVPAGTSGVPASGTISMDNLRGKSKVVPANIVLSISPTSNAEGNTFYIYTTADYDIGPIYWKLTDYTNLSDADFNTVSGTLYFDYDYGNYSVDTFTPVSDSVYEGSGTFKVTLYSDSARTQILKTSTLLTVTDTYSIGSISASNSTIYRYANLDASYKSSTVQLNTTGLEGATVYYEVYTTTAGQSLTTADVTSISGTLTVPTGGIISTTVTATEWDTANTITSDKAVVVRFRLNNSSGNILSTSPSITLIKSPTVSVSVSPTTIRESQTTFITYNMNNVPVTNPPAASVFFTTEGSTVDITTDLLGYSSTSGSFSITSNSLLIPLTAAIDTLSESNETLYITFRKTSTSGTGFWRVGDNPAGGNPPITIVSPAIIDSVSATYASISISSITSYPAGRDFTVYFKNGSSGGLNIPSTSTITVQANNISSNAVAAFVNSNDNNAYHAMQYQITSPYYATFTTTQQNEYFTWPVYNLNLSATGTNASGQSRTVYAQITSTPTYATDRVFSIEYSSKIAGSATWGAWTALSTVTVPAGSTQSSNTAIYGPVTSSTSFDLRLRCVLAGQQIKESNYLYGIWL